MPATVFAGTQDFYFDSYEAVYDLARGEDGISYLSVDERFVAIFPEFNQNKGIVRTIPRTNQGGKNVTLPRLDLALWHDGVRERPYEVESNGAEFVVSTGTEDYLHGAQEYRLAYAFERVATDFSDYQEVFWDTNGTGWGQRFGSVKVTLRLAPAIARAFTGETRCFVGVLGSINTADCEVSVNGDEIEFAATRGLMPHENLSFVVKFLPGTFVVPEPEVSYAVMTAGIIEIIVAVGMFGAAVIIYRRGAGKRRREYEPKFHPPQYLAPKDLSMLGAIKIFGKAKGAAFTAVLIDLAVRRKVKIIEKQKGGILRGRKYAVEIVELDGVFEDEKNMLAYMNGGKAVEAGMEIDLAQRVFTGAKTLKEMPLATGRELYRAGYTTVAKSKAGGVMVLAWVMCAGLIVAGMMLSIIDSGVYYQEGEWVVIMAIFVMVGATVGLRALGAKEERYKDLARKGFEMRAYLIGLYEYIKLAEAERMRILQSPEGVEKAGEVVRLYERLLPYAVIFGVEKEWAKVLERYYADGASSPSWYVGVSAFNAASFSASMGSFSSSMSSTYSSAGSGFSSGGGGSGGGGGGGGGGGR